MIKACFVILHYGDLSVTEACVSSIFKMNDIEHLRVIIVDNDTQKSDIKRRDLKDKYKNCTRVQVLQMQGNCGFSKANNAGYQYARSHYDPEYMIICNNDIEFTQKDFAERLDRIYGENPFAVLGQISFTARSSFPQRPNILNFQKFYN